MHFSPGRQSGSGVDRECGTEATDAESSGSSRIQQNSSSPKSMSGLLLTVSFPPYPARMEHFPVLRIYKENTTLFYKKQAEK